MVHLLPHWNWPGREGQPIPVMAYTNAEEVELLLDGRSLGRKRKGAEPFVIAVGKRVSDALSVETRDRIVFAVEGKGRIAAVDNGNPASLEPFQARERKAFSGLALLIVRSRRDEPGTISVSATSDGLAAARASLAAR